MKYSIDKQDRYTIFKVGDENINSLTAPDLKSEFLILRNAQVPNLVLDLSDVKYIDSSGLSAILTGHRIWKDIGSFIITGVQHDPVKKLIEISRLDGILTIIPTMQESVDYVIMQELENQLLGEEE